MTNDDTSVAEFGKVLAGVTALAAAIAALGTATGVFGAMLRNHSNWTAVDICLALLAGFLAALSGLRPKEAKRGLLVAATGAFFVASLLGLVLLTVARGESPAPSIEVHVRPATAASRVATVIGTATASGLRTGQVLQVAIYRVNKRIFWARIGSDGNGNVKLPFEVPVSASQTEAELLKILAFTDERPDYCLNANLASPILHPRDKPPGCVLVRLPPAPTR